MRPELRVYAIGLTFLILADVMQLITPQILRLFVDNLESGAPAQHAILNFALMMIGVGIVTFVSRFLWRTMCFGASRRIEYRLRRKLFAHLSTLSASFFNRSRVGDLMAHATNDVQAVRMSFAMGVVATVDSSFLIVSTVVIMFQTISAPLSMWALLPLPVSAVVASVLGKVIHIRFRRVQAAFADMTDAVQENFSGIRVVKSFAQEDAQIQGFLRQSEAYVRRNMEMVKVWGLFDPLVDAIGGISFAVATAYGGYLVIIGTLNLGQYVAFLSYLGLLRWPMQAAGWVINVLQRGAASMERLNVLFAERPEIADPPGAVQLTAPHGAVSLRNLTFRYAEDLPPALRDVSFDLRPGQTLGIIGRVGSGKTTLASVLLRLYDPPAGTVFVDGQDIRTLSVDSLRGVFGFVPQDSFLFSETIGENIAFAVDDPAQHEIERAAQVAAVHDNIVEFPSGYRTIVGERGVTLSGGQKQRVSIARAIIQDPPVLLLDDSLSAVDTQTEAAILDAVRSERAGRSNIIIAHRISAIAHADEILYLEDGEVVERGRHEDLLKLGGRYRDLYERQLLEESILNRDEEGA